MTTSPPLYVFCVVPRKTSIKSYPHPNSGLVYSFRQNKKKELQNWGRCIDPQTSLEPREAKAKKNIIRKRATKKVISRETKVKA